MCAGQIIYQGPRVEIIAYFNSIGYECPFNVDMADFLQVIPTSEGILYMQSSEKREEASDFVEYLTKSWKATAQFQKLVADVEKFTALHDDTKVDEETGLVTPMKTFWYKELNEEYPGTYWYHLDLVMRRAINVYKRDKTFIAARIGQNLFVGAVAGSLFNNISPTSVQTMNGFLFFTALFGALTGFSMLPGVFDQKAVFYKHAASLFYPASCLTLAQALVLMPQQLVETILFSTIMYWTAGLSSEYNGSRFLTFVILLFVFNVSLGQMFRMIAYMTPDMTTAAPVGGVLIVLCVLFSGFILPASQISDGWIWFYWINPVSWVLKGVTVNQFLSSTYNFNICVNSIGGNCTQFQEFGDYVLTEYGNPTEQAWVWYAFGYLIGCFFLFFGLSTFFVIYVHTESAPPAPVYEHKSTVVDSTVSGEQRFELPFDPVSFAFLGISYVVKTNDGEELTLLDEVTGVFEPGVVTALMGSSGAGK